MCEKFKPMLEEWEKKELVEHFPADRGLLGRPRAVLKAVDGVTFSIAEGAETLGLVGESGCGKSTIGRVMLNLIAPSDGQLIFEGRNIFELPRAERRALRRKMGIVFQDPYSSLNPRMNVLQIVGEPLVVHRKLKGATLKAKGGRAAGAGRAQARNRSIATRISFRAGSGNGWASHGPWRWVPSL